jgi:hypothetical protein
MITIARMIRAAWITLAILTLASPSGAQQSLKVLTPTDDTCAAFVSAMDSGDPPKVAALGGWALGFLSGVAQGAGVDILRGATAESVMNRLYAACHSQPSRQMSLVLEEIARSLVTRKVR